MLLLVVMNCQTNQDLLFYYTMNRPIRIMRIVRQRSIDRKERAKDVELNVEQGEVCLNLTIAKLEENSQQENDTFKKKG